MVEMQVLVPNSTCRHLRTPAGTSWHYIHNNCNIFAINIHISIQSRFEVSHFNLGLPRNHIPPTAPHVQSLWSLFPWCTPKLDHPGISVWGSSCPHSPTVPPHIIFFVLEFGTIPAKYNYLSLLSMLHTPTVAQSYCLDSQQNYQAFHFGIISIVLC